MSTANVFLPLEYETAADHVIGPQSAPITLIEYGDFECSTCKQAAGAVKLLLARFAPDVRLLFRPFPLEEAHPHALQAAQAAACAGAQGQFWEMHDLLFEHQQHLQLPQLQQFAESLGLDMARFNADMEDEVYLQCVREQQLTGRYAGVRATPGFFCNGRVLDVSYGMHSLFDAITDELYEQAELHNGIHTP